MSVDADDPQTHELSALKSLRTSDGWTCFLALVEQEWGPVATLEKIEQAMSALSGNLDQATVNDTVQQIQTARREIQKLLRRVDERIQQLTPTPQRNHPFAALKRIGR